METFLFVILFMMCAYLTAAPESEFVSTCLILWISDAFVALLFKDVDDMNRQIAWLINSRTLQYEKF